MLAWVSCSSCRIVSIIYKKYRFWRKKWIYRISDDKKAHPPLKCLRRFLFLWYLLLDLTSPHEKKLLPSKYNRIEKFFFIANKWLFYIFACVYIHINGKASSSSEPQHWMKRLCARIMLCLYGLCQIKLMFLLCSHVLAFDSLSEQDFAPIHLSMNAIPSMLNILIVFEKFWLEKTNSYFFYA